MDKTQHIQDKEDFALLRFSIIAPLINGNCANKTITNSINNVSIKNYNYKGRSFRFSASTIKKWYYSYKKAGFEGLINQDRADINTTKKLDTDAQNYIIVLIKHYPKIKATAVYNKLIAKHVICESDVSLRSVQRFCRMLKKTIPPEEYHRRRFEVDNPNDMWQSDTSTGPYVLLDGIKYRTYLIMFLDDASRMIVGYGFYLKDNEINMQTTFKNAVVKYGIPKVLYVDNGGPYTSRQLKLICAKLGVEHKNTRAYDPQSKGKIERCFRTIKQSWMNCTDWNKFRSLDDVDKSFSEFVYKYNHSKHSTTKKTPAEAYFAFKEFNHRSKEHISKCFMHQVVRKADSCSVVSINNRKYEAPSECIGVKSVFEYDPRQPEKIFYKNKECNLLNVNANANGKRTKTIDYEDIVNDENDVVDLNVGDKKPTKLTEIAQLPYALNHRNGARSCKN